MLVHMHVQYVCKYVRTYIQESKLLIENKYTSEQIPKQINRYIKSQMEDMY